MRYLRDCIGMALVLGVMSASATHTGWAADPPAKPAAKPAATARSKPAVKEFTFGRPLTGQSRYGWSWLAQQFDQDRDGTVTPQELKSTDSFERLDRNWDGRLSPEDFDWSESGDLAGQREATFALFKATDADSDGRITAPEWQAAFVAAARDKDYLDDHHLERLIFLPLARRQQSLLQMRQRGRELGYDSAKRAPWPGELAPDFRLRSPDGQTTLQLSEFRGKKPVVLIFGSFT